MEKVQDLAMVFTMCPINRTAFGWRPLLFQNTCLRKKTKRAGVLKETALEMHLESSSSV